MNFTYILFEPSCTWQVRLPVRTSKTFLHFHSFITALIHHNYYSTQLNQIPYIYIPPLHFITPTTLFILCTSLANFSLLSLKTPLSLSFSWRVYTQKQHEAASPQVLPSRRLTQVHAPPVRVAAAEARPGGPCAGVRRR